MNVFLAYALAVIGLIVFFKLIRIVPEQETFIIEQFGKYKRALNSGMHLVIPFVQRVAYKQLLKEEVIDVDPQICITNDNVQVTVDGILYLKVVDPVKASYGIDNYRFATAQLAKTTMRSEIGKLELDKSFSERDSLNYGIVKALDEASDPWGIKVTRYEIKDIAPTATIQSAMEQQMRAEREKRAEILSSEGEKQARINLSQGDKEEAINLSKGDRQRRINVSQGRAKAIEITADATAQGIQEIADAINQPGGRSAMSLRILEQYLKQMGNIYSRSRKSILPFDMASVKSLLDGVLASGKPGESGPSKESLLRRLQATQSGKGGNA